MTTSRERHLRDLGLDQTIEDSFPASDPPSTNPDPIAREPRVEETPMMLDWNAYRDQVLARTAALGRVSPGTVRGYRELSSAGSQKDLLGAKTRELIALAVAVTRQCDGCITIHTDAALAHGATREEIAEALGVAIAVNAGATLVFSTRVMDAYAAKTAVTPALPDAGTNRTV